MKHARTSMALGILLAATTTHAPAQVTAWTYSNFAAPVRDVAFDANDIAYVTSGTTVTRIDPVRQQAIGTMTAPFSSLTHVSPEPGGCRIAFADSATATNRVFLIEDLNTPSLREVILPTLASSEYGAWSMAWVGSDDLLVSGRFSGSGWADLRRVNVNTGQGQILNDVRQDSMLAVDPTRTHVVVAESNISSGPVSRLDPQTGSTLQTIATQRFLWDVSFDGRMAIVPTYFGGYVFDFVQGALQQRQGVIGVYADYGPIATAFAPHTDVVFESTWSFTESKRALTAYTARDLVNSQIIELRPELTSVGNRAFVRGRIAVSENGYWLALTMDNSVRFYDVRSLAAKPDEIFASTFGRCAD